MVYSAALFGLPTALYHLALARVRDDAVLLAIVIAVIATVYLPTCFFIVGEYNTTYAAVVAAMAVALTAAADAAQRRGAAAACSACSACAPTRRWSISARSIAAAIVWSARRGRRPVGEGLLALVGRAGLHRGRRGFALVAIVDYWNHPHFLKVRAMTFDFWQNLQFAIAAGRARDLGGGRAAAAVVAAGPRAGVVIAIAAAALALSPWYRLLGPRAFHPLSAGALSRPPGGRRGCWRCCWSACGCTSPGSDSRAAIFTILRRARGVAAPGHWP